MSNLICKCCESNRVVDDGYYAGSTFYRCKNCGSVGGIGAFSKPTVFHRITQSPETLAQELVTLDCDGWWAYIGIGKRKSYLTREEAIAATLKKLKEVAE